MDISGFEKDRLDQISCWLDSQITRGRYAGASLIINKAGQRAFSHAVGYRDAERQLAFADDTIVRLYSMTKPIVSTLLMHFVERGEVHLAAPLSDFLPQFAECRALVETASHIDQTQPCACPSLHQLLTHTSGLTYGFNPGLVGSEMYERNIFHPNGRDLESHIGELAQLPLAFAPGARWEYSVGIDVIGRVIEIIAGKPLDQILDEIILQPLGMHETGFKVPMGLGSRFANLYSIPQSKTMQLDRAGRDIKPMALLESADESVFHHPVLLSGGGGLVGTADDFCRFAEMLRCDGQTMSERILAPQTVRFMKQNHLSGDIAQMGATSFAEQPMTGMGFGIGGAVLMDPARQGIPGSIGDYSWGGMASTFFWIDPVYDLVVVFLTQLIPSRAYPSRAELKALVHAAIAS